MTNPYVYTKEITDPTLFAGRQAELATIKSEITNFAKGKTMVSFALIGVRRVGKTSTLLRIAELCEENSIFCVRITVNDNYCQNPWDFWFGMFQEILYVASIKNIILSDVRKPLTFWKESTDGHETNREECHLSFEESYKSSKEGSYPNNLVLENDLNSLLIDIILKAGYKGLLFMFDEAQKLQEAKEANHIKESLRKILGKIPQMGLIFAGTERLESIFNNYDEAFYQQGHIIPITNFTLTTDLRECALLPLNEGERKLMSPMTIDYLAML